MTRNSIIYSIHVLIVVATAVFAAKASIANWYFGSVILLPLLFAASRRFGGVSYTINARILFPLSVGLFFVAFYHYFPQFMVDEGAANLARSGITNASDVAKREFFQVDDVFKDSVTILYAICVAFLLLKGLNDFDELKTVLYEEVNEIRTISDYSSYFTNGNLEENAPVIVSLRKSLLKYLDNILDGGKIVINAENEQVLADCLMTVGQLKQGDINDAIALEEIMKGLSRVANLRAKRAVCIEKRMSPLLLSLMFLMSITMVSFFFDKATGEFGFNYIYVFMLPMFYAAIFMTLLDLSSPFDGYWSIKLEAVRGVQEKLRSQLGSLDDPLVTHPSSTPK